jgi:acylphosphatase
MEHTRASIVVSGKVQGVFFRASACEQATHLTVTGWVRNRRDGAVELLVEGERKNVEALIRWCHQGPPRARVEKVEVCWEPFQGEFERFTVAY